MTTASDEDTVPKRTPTDAALGRRAAKLIFRAEDDADLDISDPFTMAFAQGAIKEFSALINKLPAKVHSVLRGARRSATAQNENPFHGITEMVQNADDQGATAVSIALSGSHLLLSHNGRRVEVSDVLPISLPFLSTKLTNANALGRWGIGLKTLDRMGSNLEVHSHPYHFRIDRAMGLSPVKAAAGVPRMYDPTQEETLFDLELLTDLDLEAMRRWLGAWDSSSLLFLNSVRALRVIDPQTGDLLQEHRLIPGAEKLVVADHGGRQLEIAETQLYASDNIRSWTRYTLEVPTAFGIEPEFKAINETTPLSVAIPQSPRTRRIFIGLTTKLNISLPFHINAQFEPTTDRESLLDSGWNRWLIDQFQYLVTPLILHRFLTSPREAWAAVPLLREAKGTPLEWLETSMQGLVGAVHEGLRAQLQIPINGELASLSSLVYEDAALDGLLSTRDQQELKPNLRSVPLDLRDSRGRWRSVLDDLNTSSLLTVQDALEILKWDDTRLGVRPVTWYINLVAAAIDNHVEHALSNYKYVMTAQGHCIKPGRSKDPILVRRRSENDLAAYLQLSEVIHPTYLTEDKPAVTVRTWLERSKYLTDRPEPQEVLGALLARARSQRLELDVDALRLLRDLLSGLEGYLQEFYGKLIGELIWVDAFQWQDGKRVRRKARPSEAYQPQSIDKQPQSWAHAAGTLPGLTWLAASYGETLSGERGQQLSPVRLFRLLGAETKPRLLPSPGTTSMRNKSGYSLRNRSADDQPPYTQKAALGLLPRQAEVLIGDHQSPDLAAVIRDIAAMPVGEMRINRARALLATLSRSWGDHYGQHNRAVAAYSYQVFRQIGTVPATWIADAASIQWLSNSRGEAKAPREVVQATPDNMLVYYHEQDRWAAEIAPEDNLSEAMLRALWVEVNPYTTTVLKELEKLREKTQKGEVIDKDQPGRLYEILAGRITNPYGSMVGTMTAQEFKARFGGKPEKPGLVYADGAWYPPKSVFLSPRIFGNRRAFLVDRPETHALWQFLEISNPEPKDCIKVLQEISQEYPTSAEEAILLDTYRHLEKKLTLVVGSDIKTQLGSLPLWTDGGWQELRPVLATDAPDLRRELTKHVPMWTLEFPSSLPNLVAALDVTLLHRGQFYLASPPPQAGSSSQSLADDFTLAIQHLRDRLAELNVDLYNKCSIPWDQLEAAHVWLVPELTLQVDIAGRGVVDIEVSAHVETKSGALPNFYFRNREAVGELDAGGTVIKSLFPSIPSASSIDAEWFLAWTLVELERKPKHIQLANTKLEIEEETARISIESPGFQLHPATSKATSAVDQHIQSGSTTTITLQSPGETQTPHELPGRQLKTFKNDIVMAEVESGSNTVPGQIKRRERRGITGDTTSPDKPHTTAVGPRLYTNEQTEDAGVELLTAIFRQRFGRELYDYRRQPEVGADLKDDLGHYYELKVSGGEMPDEVALQANQLERARQQGENYTLVLISGLERGEITKIKLFRDPLSRLDWKSSSRISLAGVLSKEGTLLIVEEPSDEAPASTDEK